MFHGSAPIRARSGHLKGFYQRSGIGSSTRFLCDYHAVGFEVSGVWVLGHRVYRLFVRVGESCVLEFKVHKRSEYKG